MLRFRSMLPVAALGLAVLLGGCVAYPAYPGYAAYPAYGYGYTAPVYAGGYYGGYYGGYGHGYDGGWRR